MLDIDDFKQINDTYGHLQGDKVLRMVGRVLQLESRGVDEPARYGGEEFAVALPETGLEGALDLAERVRARIESEQVPRAGGAGAVSVTASVGAASMPGSADGAEALIAAADAALYEAKRAGKNRVASARRAAGRGPLLSGAGSGWLAPDRPECRVRGRASMQESVPARPGQVSSLFPDWPMGILDDAIREHLELKRRHGATDSELQRLEDEAFGPPSRPGEPDFPEQEGESAEQSGNGVAREGAVAEAPVAPEAPPTPPEGEQVERPDEPDERRGGGADHDLRPSPATSWSAASHRSRRWTRWRA